MEELGGCGHNQAKDKGLTMYPLIEDYLKDCHSRGVAIGSMPRYRPVLKFYQRDLASAEGGHPGRGQRGSDRVH